MENDTTPKFYVESLSVDRLWGIRSFKLSFKKEVNILIGPNASGKTTVINLLRYILSVDYERLSYIPFEVVTIKLKSFDNHFARTVKVQSKPPGFKFDVSKRSFLIDPARIDPRRRYSPSLRRRLMEEQIGELGDMLRGLVPAVWLPVSRRLPITDEDKDERRAHRESDLESVDACLRRLMDELSRYRMNLNAQLSELYKEFQTRVLETILYDKKHDVFEPMKLLIPTAAEKDQLVGAFREAGLLDSKMRKKIDGHFERAKAALRRIRIDEERFDTVQIEDVLIIPLLKRTGFMVQFAQQLEKNRQHLFAPLNRFLDIVNSFLDAKTVSVDEKGRLEISSSAIPQRQLSAHLLSSGEKQILILLIQALLWENRPVVYVADEPELSLHVSWQEKLLQSLLDLGGETQIIVATHSPDIVGSFRENVIDLGSAR